MTAQGVSSLISTVTPLLVLLAGFVVLQLLVNAVLRVVEIRRSGYLLRLHFRIVTAAVAESMESTDRAQGRDLAERLDRNVALRYRLALETARQGTSRELADLNRAMKRAGGKLGRLHADLVERAESASNPAERDYWTSTAEWVRARTAALQRIRSAGHTEIGVSPS